MTEERTSSATVGAGPVVEAIGALLGPLLTVLDGIAWVQRHFHPPVAGKLAEVLGPPAAALSAALGDLERAPCPAEVRGVRDRLVDVARQCADLVSAFAEGARSPGDLLGLFRPLRRFARVQETLYPLAPALDPVSRWFLEPGKSEDDELIERLRAGALRDGEPRVGVLHAHNDRQERGGFSLYAPEAWDGDMPLPLVVALHGGSGHGRDFLWSWLRDARSRNVLLAAPTSRDRTWSIMGGEDVDVDALHSMVESVAARYPVDRARVLLTGMSDGATYALVCGLRDETPFTHLAPASGTLHPYLLAHGGLERARGRPIYLIHGALDWMFPVQTARMAADVLRSCGARLVYREIEDLSHTYPRDENPKILDWLVDA
jgi:phospholipase/carboxylesterase